MDAVSDFKDIRSRMKGELKPLPKVEPPPEVCPRCNGDQLIWGMPCGACYGSGVRCNP